MHSERKIQAVIFDMDGVLTDSEPLINAAAVAMFREKGLMVQPEDFLPFVGTGEDRYIGGVAEKYHFGLDLPSAKQRTYEIYLKLVPQRLNAFPGAQNLVHACKSAAMKVALASSADRIKVEANLRKVGLPVETWDAVVTGDDVANKKPAPDIFLAAADKLGVLPTQCVVVEDAPNGIQAAKAAGMRCVAVAQSFPPSRLATADVTRETIAQVTVQDLTEEGADRIPPPFLPGSASLPPKPDAQSAEQPVSKPWGFWATLGFAGLIAGGVVFTQTVAAVAFVVGAKVLGRTVHLEQIDQNGLLMAVLTCLSAVPLIGLAWLFAWIRRGITVVEYLAIRRVSAASMLKFCLGLLVFVAASDGITLLLGRPVVPDVMVNAYSTAGFLPLLWLALIVFAPISEEMLFRGFMFAGFAASPLGGPGAIVLTSLGWAALHVQYDWYGIVCIFAGGLLLGYARLKTRSVLPPMLMHSLMNLIATLEVTVKVSQGGGATI